MLKSLATPQQFWFPLDVCWLCQELIKTWMRHTARVKWLRPRKQLSSARLQWTNVAQTGEICACRNYTTFRSWSGVCCGEGLSSAGCGLLVGKLVFMQETELGQEGLVAASAQHRILCN